MIDAGIVGLGWWGKNLVEAVQGKSDHLRFVRGTCRDIRPAAAFAERHGLALSSSLTELLADGRVEVRGAGDATLAACRADHRCC